MGGAADISRAVMKYSESIPDITGWGEGKIDALGTFGTIQGATLFIVGTIRRASKANPVRVGPAVLQQWPPQPTPAPADPDARSGLPSFKAPTRAGLRWTLRTTS